MKKVAVAAFAAALSLGGFAATVVPRTTAEALVNPGMGWVFYYFDDGNYYYGAETKPGDVLDWFPGLSTIYFRIPWSDIEPEEGRFRWDVIDSVAQPWIAAGKQLCFRFTCQEGSHAYSVPKWVVDAGAKGELIKSDRFGGNGVWDPEWLDPIFLEKYGNFLAAAAKKWDGHPSVAFIDVGSFGMWGECHTGYTRQLSREKYGEIALVHSRLLKSHFKRTPVVISDDAFGSWNKAEDSPYFAKVREMGVGLRDDSIMVSAKPNQWFHGGWARKSVAAGLLSVVETAHFWPSCRGKTNWFEGGLLKSTVEYQAHFQGVHWWPKEFLELCRKEIDEVNLRLGYRFELREVTFPDAVAVGKEVKIMAKWANVGVAPPIAEYFAAWTLLDEKGTVVWTSIDDRFDFRKVRPTVDSATQLAEVESCVTFGWNFPSYQKPPESGVVPPMLYRFDGTVRKELQNVRAPTIAPGEYTLAVSVGDRNGTPKIALAIEGQLGKTRRYELGKVKLVEGGK